MKVEREFFNSKKRSLEEIAKDLLGSVICRRIYGYTILKAIVSGVVCYHGIGKGTRNPEGMRREYGTIYIMPYRGSYFFNITTGTPENPSCIHISQIYFRGKTYGPSWTKEFKIDRSLDGYPIDGEEVWIEILKEKIREDKRREVWELKINDLITLLYR